MARKSRKNLSEKIKTERNMELFASSEQRRIPTAIYVRLSFENNGREDEESLINQISYVHSYLLEHSDEYELVDTYVDNGHTGTNFDRPGFARLMDDVNHGRIECIIVKDLSRFGRNYIETGVYIENILPKLHVKLIAINDDFDSSRDADRQSISIPVKNMVNEMYSRDISRKMFIANKLHRMKGDALPIGPNPYGYRKDSACNKYIPDENADYVRMIFQWSVMGVSLYEIADRLDLIGAPIARNRYEKRAGATNWTGSAVIKTLANPVYAGDICMGRRKRTIVGSQRHSIEVPREQWVVHRNTHEALVPRADYDLLYERRRRNQTMKNNQMEDARRNMTGISVDFGNIVYCAECQKKMITKTERHGKGDEHTHVKYVCTNRKKTDYSCYNYVYNDLLKVLVMDQLRSYIKLLTDHAEVVKRIKELGNGKDIVLSIDKQIVAVSVNVEEQRQKEAKLYEDYKEGIITEEDFKLVHEKQILSRQRAEAQLRELNAKKDSYVRVINNYLSMVDGLDIHPSEDGFDGRLVMEMVERINVFHDNRIEIVFKNHDIEELIAEVLENR